MAAKNNFIAVFDSGVGGISVLRELLREMPQERYLYFGDSANAPYGIRSTEEVRELTLKHAEKLFVRGAKALVVACNTATSAAIACLRSKYPDKIIIGIEPALKVAADRFPSGTVGVMATEVTLREEKFLQQLARFPQMQVHTISPSGLVELIEQGSSEAALEALLSPVLTPYANKLDALVLGCTHYPFAAPVISRILGDRTVLLHGGCGTARETHRRLAEAGLLREGTGEVLLENSLPDLNILKLSKELLRKETEL